MPSGTRPTRRLRWRTPGTTRGFRWLCSITRSAHFGMDCGGPEEPHSPCAIQTKAAPNRAETGSVRIHAQRILSTTPHFTALRRFDAPTPMIEVDITWVVETGTPRVDAP